MLSHIQKLATAVITFRNNGEVFGLLPTTQSNLRTALGVEIFKLGIIARICKPFPEWFSDLCSNMGTSICSEIQI